MPSMPVWIRTSYSTLPQSFVSENSDQQRISIPMIGLRWNIGTFNHTAARSIIRFRQVGFHLPPLVCPSQSCVCVRLLDDGLSLDLPGRCG